MYLVHTDKLLRSIAKRRGGSSNPLYHVAAVFEDAITPTPLRCSGQVGAAVITPIKASSLVVAAHDGSGVEVGSSSLVGVGGMGEAKGQLDIGRRLIRVSRVAALQRPGNLRLNSVQVDETEPCTGGGTVRTFGDLSVAGTGTPNLTYSNCNEGGGIFSRDATTRIVDLIPVARAHYYHPDLRGSWSIKAVLPTIAPELAYDDLDVADGQMAQDAFAEMIHPETAVERREELRRGLLEYCRRDTEAMVRVFRFFLVR